MKRILLVMAMFLLAGMMVYGTAEAKVAGLCVNCHTMHNSQDGTIMTVGGITAAQPHLARSSCTGCHTGSGVQSAPIVDKAWLNAAMPAGGTFATNATHSKVHNVADLSIAGDTALTGNVAPGGITLGSQLQCAGANGCHGNHVSTDSSLAINGFHHGSTAYRFTRVAVGNSGTGTDVNGKGSTDYERNGAEAADHNVYSADGSTGISKFCANCHNTFHATTQSGGNWIRHPTDTALTNVGGTVVNLVSNPYAFTTSDINAGMLTTDLTTGTAYTKANGRVMCLSCHRAHGTDYPDLLRWDYTASGSQLAGSGGTFGCLGCHSAQR